MYYVSGISHQPIKLSFALTTDLELSLNKCTEINNKIIDMLIDACDGVVTDVEVDNDNCGFHEHQKAEDIIKLDCRCQISLYGESLSEDKPLYPSENEIVVTHGYISQIDIEKFRKSLKLSPISEYISMSSISVNIGDYEDEIAFEFE